VALAFTVSAANNHQKASGLHRMPPSKSEQHKRVCNARLTESVYFVIDHMTFQIINGGLVHH